MPSAPLRAFSYTMAGGASSCGQRPNAVFKCPDGYAGSYPERLPPQGGYHDFRNPACNPFSNKIVLMDEVSLTRLHAARLSLTRLRPFHQVHNLVRPSPEILRNDQRMLMLQRLRQLLRTAENAVIIGLSGTPLADVPAEAAALQNLIKGKLHHQLNDEGFVSVRALLLSSHSPFLHINTPSLSLSAKHTVLHGDAQIRLPDAPAESRPYDSTGHMRSYRAASQPAAQCRREAPPWSCGQPEGVRDETVSRWSGP